MTDSPKIIIARHGETDFNSTGGGSPERLRGWLNVPLNLHGIMEAKKLSDNLAGQNLTDVITSDLSRASQTAFTVAKNHKLPITQTPNLRPWNLGNLQGKEVSSILPALEDHINNPTKAVPGGESFDDFRNRYLSLLSRVMDFSKQMNRNVLLTTHTRNTQLAKAWLAKGMPNDLSIDKDVMNNFDKQTHTGQFLTLKPDGNGPWQLS